MYHNLKIDKSTSFNDNPSLDELRHSLLENSIEITNETEEIGMTVLNQLIQQGEQIEESSGQISNIQTISSTSKKYLKKIGWKICKEKLTLMYVILLLVLIDGSLFYRLFTNNGHIF